LFIHISFLHSSLEVGLVLPKKKNLHIISASKTFPLSKKVADVMLLRAVCPCFCQLPPKQAATRDRSSGTFSATAFAAVCITCIH